MTNGSDGMTLRDYFAGQALVGLVAAAMTQAKENGSNLAAAVDMCSRTCYRFADAMLAAREANPC